MADDEPIISISKSLRRKEVDGMAIKNGCLTTKSSRRHRRIAKPRCRSRMKGYSASSQNSWLFYKSFIESSELLMWMTDGRTLNLLKFDSGGVKTMDKVKVAKARRTFSEPVVGHLDLKEKLDFI